MSFWLAYNRKYLLIEESLIVYSRKRNYSCLCQHLHTEETYSPTLPYLRYGTLTNAQILHYTGTTHTTEDRARTAVALNTILLNTSQLKQLGPHYWSCVNLHTYLDALRILPTSPAKQKQSQGFSIGYIQAAMVLAEIELIFSIEESDMQLYFGFVLETRLITHGCFSYSWAALTQQSHFLVLTPPHKQGSQHSQDSWPHDTGTEDNPSLNLEQSIPEWMDT